MSLFSANNSIAITSGSLLSLKANQIEEIVVLSACGIRFEWPFKWDSEKCPVRNCREPFDARADAIAHFMEKHAGRSTLCSICQKPIVMRTVGDIQYHYRCRHPGIDLPSHYHKLINANRRIGVKSQKVRSKNESCAKNASERMNLGHKRQGLVCPLTYCNYEVTQMTDLCKHWTQKHNELEFPQYCEKTRSTKSVAISNAKLSRKVCSKNTTMLWLKIEF